MKKKRHKRRYKSQKAKRIGAQHSSRSKDPADQLKSVTPTEVVHHDVGVVPYDESLLERARTQWQFGDWYSLSQISRDSLQHHPDRAKLALLAAAGRLQCGSMSEAQRFLRLAKDWGCGEELIGRILIAGVHNSLGRATAITGQYEQALHHFEQSLTTGTPGADTGLLIQARTMYQLEQVPLPDLNSQYPLSNSDTECSDKAEINGISEISRYFKLSLGKERFLFPSYLRSKTTSNYYIKEKYTARTEYTHHDDMHLTDEYQLDVYLYAFGQMKKNAYEKVVDIGCGSGYKLVTYLGEYETLGLELEENVEILKEQYPNRDWRISTLEERKVFSSDLVICADVIEHLVDPDELIEHLICQDFKLLILSTPERDLVRGENDLGPPKNKAHVREWNFEEFGNYINERFDIVKHFISSVKHGTQLVMCKKR